MDEQRQSKEDCVNGLKYMAAYKALSLGHIRKHGLKGTVLEHEEYVTVEESQLRVLQSAIFYLTGEEFVPPEYEEPHDSRNPRQ
jgi:hypothetical protein